MEQDAWAGAPPDPDRVAGGWDPATSRPTPQELEAAIRTHRVVMGWARTGENREVDPVVLSAYWNTSLWKTIGMVLLDRSPITSYGGVEAECYDLRSDPEALGYYHVEIGPSRLAEWAREVSFRPCLDRDEIEHLREWYFGHYPLWACVTRDE